MTWPVTVALHLSTGDNEVAVRCAAMWYAALAQFVQCI